jgi:hypothetical protein
MTDLPTALAGNSFQRARAAYGRGLVIGLRMAYGELAARPPEQRRGDAALIAAALRIAARLDRAESAGFAKAVLMTLQRQLPTTTTTTTTEGTA